MTQLKGHNVIELINLAIWIAIFYALFVVFGLWALLPLGLFLMACFADA
jgi:hypothetical protein